jgi:4-amino-4-deoxy-L-arabinose transferase-like glycosyltransferase
MIATRGRLAALLVLLIVVWFGGLGHRKLIKPDEGRYAEIPREMVASGDWTTPRLNGLKYFEKPPLQYWTTAIAYEAFGASEATSRLWTALTGFLGILVVGFTGARLYDRRTGLFASTVLASCVAYVLLGHFNTLDMGLAFFMATTLCATLLARDARARATGHGDHCGASPDALATQARRWMLVGWAALALATLSKGPVAVVLSGGALVFYLLLSRDWTLLRSLVLVRGIALFLVITAPWFIAVSRANPEFAHFFFIHEHVERFLTTEHRREGPIWYFVPVLAIGLLPWLSLVVASIARRFPPATRGTFAPERLLVAWCAVIFVFFSVSGSKLPSYVLPMFPALALLVAPYLARSDARTLRRHLIAIAMLAGIVCLAVLALPHLMDSADTAEAVARFRIAALIAMLAWLVGTLVALRFAWRDRVDAAIVTTGLAALVAWSGLLIGHETLGRGMSTYDLAAQMKPAIEPDTTIYSIGIFEHTLDFYLARTVTLVSFRDELDFGLTQEPTRGIATIEEFRRRWTAERAPLAIMSHDVFDTLVAAHLPLRVIADDRRRIVIGKPEAPSAPAPTAIPGTQPST